MAKPPTVPGSKLEKRRRAKEKEERRSRIEDQVARGELVIRRMTPEERAAYPPRQRA